MGSPIQVLLVEDSPSDARLTVEAMRDAGIKNEFHLVKDGEEALQFLHKEGRFQDAPTPDFVLLDLDLPKIDGREVLDVMKADAELKRIPVIILTSSKKDDDISNAYEHQVSCYIKKPVDPDQYFLAMRALKELWFKVVTLPKPVKAAGQS
jgi:chemotaxis family two-component system response regulator Rcp1